MNKIICYINSNYIQIQKNNNITTINSNSIVNGEVIDSKIFKKEMKSTKLFNSLFCNEVEIMLNKEIKEKDKLYYELIFEDLNCNNITITSTKDKLDNKTLIFCSPIYILYFKSRFIKLEEELLEYYLKIHKINKLKIISSEKLKDNKNCKYFYYNNSDNYFFQKDI